MNTWSIVVAAIVVLTSVWVLIDALTLGIKKTQEKSALNMGAVSWFLSCLLLWVLCFPLYLVKRTKHLAQTRNTALHGQAAVNANCPSCGLALSITPDLFGQLLQCPTCQGQFAAPQPFHQSWYRGVAPAALGYITYAVALGCIALSFFSGSVLLTATQLETEVRKNIQDNFRKNPAMMLTEIKSFNLVRDNGNKYKGILTAETSGKTETAEVDVTYDGRSFMWKIGTPTTTAAAIPNQPKIAPPKKVEYSAEVQEAARWSQSFTVGDTEMETIVKLEQKLPAVRNVSSMLAITAQTAPHYRDLMQELKGFTPKTYVVKNATSELISLVDARMKGIAEILEAFRRNDSTTAARLLQGHNAYDAEFWNKAQKIFEPLDAVLEKANHPCSPANRLKFVVCNQNKKVIAQAKQDWALDKNRSDDDIPSEADLLPFFENHKIPRCPNGGQYLIGKVSEFMPHCSLEEHEIKR